MGMCRSSGRGNAMAMASTGHMPRTTATASIRPETAPRSLCEGPFTGRTTGHRGSLSGYPVRGHGPDTDLHRDRRNSAPYLPKCVVIDPAFAWEQDRPPRTPWPHTLIYPFRVKGMTARHPAVPPEWRGTYTGLTHPALLDYFHRLGVTAVELLPVQQFLRQASSRAAGVEQLLGV